MSYSGKAVTGLNKPNQTGYFYPAKGEWKLQMLPMKASTAMAEGALVAVEVSGSSPTGNHTIAGTTNANGQNVVGILVEPIVSTDADYATAGKLKGVLIPQDNFCEAYFTVGAGTFTAADVGRVCQIHTDSKSVAVDTNGLGVQISGYISATRGRCKLLKAEVVTS